MFKKCKVIILPSNERSKAGDLYIKDNILSNIELGISNVVLQHLYILSDEEIKENDWCICNFKTGIEIRQNIHGRIGSTIGGAKYLYEKCSKIIATTNKLLKIECSCCRFKNNNSSVICDCTCNYIPKPSQSFIDKYIREYNKGNKIEEILIEYEEEIIAAYLNHHLDGELIDSIKLDDNIISIKENYKDTHNGLKVSSYVGIDKDGNNVKYIRQPYGNIGNLSKRFNRILKISSDNTITIKKVKDSWNKEDLEKAFNDGAAFKEKYYTLIDDTIKHPDFNKWFEENL